MRIIDCSSGAGIDDERFGSRGFNATPLVRHAATAAILRLAPGGVRSGRKEIGQDGCEAGCEEKCGEEGSSKEDHSKESHSSQVNSAGVSGKQRFSAIRIKRLTGSTGTGAK